MKNTITIATLCSALAFSAAWLMKPDTNANENEPTEKSSKRPSRPARTSATPSSEKLRILSPSVVEMSAEYSMEEVDPERQKRMDNDRETQRKIERDQRGEKSDLKIVAIVKELGLDATQEKALRAYSDERLDILCSADRMDSFRTPEALKAMAATTRGDGMSDYMKDFLSEEQMEELETYQKRQKNNKIEARAMKKLANLQTALDLNDDQRDAVYSILVEDIDKSTANRSDAHVVFDGFINGGRDRFELDFDDLSLRKVTNVPLSLKVSADNQARILAEMNEKRTKEIDAKVERMASVLDDAQLKQYRNVLEG